MAKAPKTPRKTAKTEATKPPRQKPAIDRRDIFILRYLEHHNASRAYREAGYKDGSGTHQNASRLMTSDYVKERLAEKKAELLAALEVEPKHILALQRDIAFADRAEITEYLVGACRYCHGIDHAYQWRTPREFSDAMETYMGKGEAYHANHAPPSSEGGYGYRHGVAPHPDCPECEGEGIERIKFKPTRLMTEAERNIFAGIESTPSGMRYRFEDRAKAIESLAQHVQFYKDRDKANSDNLAEAIAAISARGSKMPIRKDETPEGTT